MTRLWPGWPVVQFWQGKEIFLCSKSSRPPLGPSQPNFQWVLVVFFSVDKQQEHEIKHSSLCVANVWKEWSCTSSQPVCLWGTNEAPLRFTNILETTTVTIFRVFMLYNFVGMYKHMHTFSEFWHCVLPMFQRFLPIVLHICTSQKTVFLENKLRLLCNASHL